MADKVQIKLTSPEEVNLNVSRPDQTITVDISGRGQKGEKGAPGDIGFELGEGYWHPGVGNDPLVPSAAILAHLQKYNSNVIEVNYPENITAAGLTHNEVLQAAVYYLDHGEAADTIGAGGFGYWARGEIRLQAGTYLLDDEWEVPSRVNITGLGGENVRDAGTTLKYLAGGNLQSGGASKYIVKQYPSDGVQYDGSFFSNIANLSIECQSVCSGLAWGGAQCSSARRIQIRGVAEAGVGFDLGSGSNGFVIQGVWVDGAAGVTNIGFRIAGYTLGVAMIACKSEDLGTGIYASGGCGLNIVGFYNETCYLPLFTPGGSNTHITASGFDSKKIKGRDGSGNAVFLECTDDDTSLDISGRVRNVNDGGAAVPVGYENELGFFKVADDVKENGVMRTFELKNRPKFRDRPVDLADGTVLTQGRSYYESLTGVASRTYTFSDANTDAETVELFMVTDTSLTLTIPTSRQSGSSGTTTSVVLGIGNHHLRWKKAGGEWWMDVN